MRVCDALTTTPKAFDNVAQGEQSGAAAERHPGWANYWKANPEGVAQRGVQDSRRLTLGYDMQRLRRKLNAKTELVEIERDEQLNTQRATGNGPTPGSTAIR
jgi:hypothetical protein